MTFANNFSRSLRKFAQLCEKSRVSVSDKEGHPQEEERNGEKEEMKKHFGGLPRMWLQEKKLRLQG